MFNKKQLEQIKKICGMAAEANETKSWVGFEISKNFVQLYGCFEYKDHINRLDFNIIIISSSERDKKLDEMETLLKILLKPTEQLAKENGKINYEGFFIKKTKKSKKINDK